MHQSTDKKKKYFLYFLIFLLLSTINNLSLIRSKELLSNIKTIEVSGLKNNLNLSIKKNFEFLLNKNIFQINEELLIDQSGRNGLDTVQHIWTKTGLTAGTSYTYYVGFKSTSTIVTPHIQFGGNATNQNPDFIMKATALPATIAT